MTIPAPKPQPQDRSSSIVLLFIILFFFLFQQLTLFIESIYAFGLLSVDLPPEIVVALLLLSPAVLLLFKRGLPRGLMLAVGFLALTAAVVAPLLPTREKMFVAGIGTALLLILLPVLLGWLSGREKQSAGLSSALGLTAAVLVLLAAAAFTRGMGLFSGGNLVLAAYGGWALWVMVRDQAPARTDLARTAGFWRVAALCLGLFGGLLLLYEAFSVPFVIARWTDAPILLVTGLSLLAFAALAVVLVYRPALLALPRGLLLAWNALFALALTATIALNQTPLAGGPDAFPVWASPTPALAWVALVVMLLLVPVIVVDMALYAGELAQRCPSPRQLAGGFTLGAFFLLVMIFAQVFTTVYDYIPVVGPLMRDRFWLAFLMPALALALPALSVKPIAVSAFSSRQFVFILALPVLALIPMLFNTAHPAPAHDKTSLRVLTYNIQQGFNRDGQKDYQGQMETIREAYADIIGLEESDTARIANGNGDVVRFIADQLDLYSYYGPKTVTGTFGIALLSKYPIEDARTFYMYSKGEQTAAILAKIRVGGKTLNVVVTHLGNGGPIIQQQQVLGVIGGLENVIAMGDFNFRPDSEQYALTTATLASAWDTAAQRSASIDLAKRIDHIFVTLGMPVTRAEYIDDGSSDHPALMVEIDLR